MATTGSRARSAGNGIYDNFFNSVGNGSGAIDSVELSYAERTNIGPIDVKLGIFGMYESFAAVSPRLVFRTGCSTHEEISLQYSRYWDGSDVLPQQWLSLVGTKNIATRAGFATPGAYKNFAGPVYPNDHDVFGAKVTLWW